MGGKHLTSFRTCRAEDRGKPETYTMVRRQDLQGVARHIERSKVSVDDLTAMLENSHIVEGLTIFCSSLNQLHKAVAIRRQ